MPLIKLANRTFGRLTVIRRGPDKVFTSRIEPRWWCRCECGARVLVAGQPLRNGRTRSCGCLQREEATARIRARNDAVKAAKEVSAHG